MGDLTKNFSRKEFECQGKSCCGHSAPVSMEFVESLQMLREFCGHPLTIISGFRCNVHNESVGGSPGSKHRLGIAADVTCEHLSPSDLAKFAERVPGFDSGGIGLYSTWIHVDTRDNGPARWDKR